MCTLLACLGSLTSAAYPLSPAVVFSLYLIHLDCCILLPPCILADRGRRGPRRPLSARQPHSSLHSNCDISCIFSKQTAGAEGHADRSRLQQLAADLEEARRREQVGGYQGCDSIVRATVLLADW